MLNSVTLTRVPSGTCTGGGGDFGVSTPEFVGAGVRGRLFCCCLSNSPASGGLAAGGGGTGAVFCAITSEMLVAPMTRSPASQAFHTRV